MNVRSYIGKKTLSVRHKIVKIVAPKLYNDAIANNDLIGHIPRPMTLFMKDYYGNTKLTGVEIGVAAGVNAENMLTLLNIQKLYLIDPYVPYFEGGGVSDFSKDKKEAVRRLSKFSQVVFIEKTSKEAVKDINAQLDFVYIDGNHDYQFVKEDIEHYYPLVKQGGVIGGHDYTPIHLGVIQAVNEFAHQHDYKQGFDFFTLFPDWWLIKQQITLKTNITPRICATSNV